jgi:hypothetical protein
MPVPELVDVGAIPPSREGYALDTAKHIVHRRWALHARGLPRVKSVHEVRAWLGAQVGVCPDVSCWAAPVASEPPAPEISAPRHRKPRALDDNELLPGPVASMVESVPAVDLSNEPASIESEAADGVETAPEVAEA